jgi:putative transposase
LARSVGALGYQSRVASWRREYGGLKVDQARRLKDLEQENARLKRAVADLTLDKLILKEAAEGNWFSIRGTWVKAPFVCLAL